MNNNNTLIGALAVIIVLGGVVWLVSSGAFSSGTTATSTPTTGTETTTTSGNTAAAPRVSTAELIEVSKSTALVNGTIVPNGAQTSYWFEYGKTAALGTRTTSQTVGSGYATVNAPAVLNGLSANTTYYFRLMAQNSLGVSTGNSASFETNNTPPIVGDAPTTRTDAATGITRTSANLNGHTNPNNVETSYWFEYGTTNELGNITPFQSAGKGGVSLDETLSVPGLAPATKYFFRMNAQNRFGTASGAILSFTTSGPAAPKAPSADTKAATNITASSATLHGVVNPNGAHTTYWFEYSDDSILGHIIGSTTHTEVAGSGTSAVDVSAALTGLSSDTTYSYRLVTQNSLGTTRGDIVTFKTKQ